MWVRGITLGTSDFLTLKISRLRQAVLELCWKKGNFFTCFNLAFCFSLVHVIEIFYLHQFCHYSLCLVCWITMFGKHKHQKLKMDLVPEKRIFDGVIKMSQTLLCKDM